MTEYTSHRHANTSADNPTGAGRLTPQRLCARLRSMTARLRRHYTLANASPMRSAVDEWLCDNYYVLEKESKQTVRDIRQLTRRGPGSELIWLYTLFDYELSGARPPLTDETMLSILTMANTRQPLSERQFGFISAAVKAVLIGMAHNAVCGSNAVADDSNVECMAYAITGFRGLTSIDLQEIIHKCSGVEQVLLRDPAGVYEAMTDDTRSYYRHLIAAIATATRSSEQQVARELLEKAQAEQRHIGEYIVRHPVLIAAKRRRGIASIVFGIALPLFVGALFTLWSGSFWLPVLCFLPLWEILRTPIQQLALAGVDVDYIPRMDLTKVKNKPATVVLVSTLLPKTTDAPALAGRLEQLYFANSDPDLYFCILADLGEWDFPTDEKDDSQITATAKVIERLNRLYGERFMLFLRARTYNKTQRRYSGWERKRGAITEFVRFLKGESTSLHTFVGNREILPHIRFLIALDSDTSLLYESAQTLVSAAIHPLGRPVVGKSGVVEQGYGILAPKISTDLDSARATAFSRVMSGCGGVTAYESRDKDFYQDLFGESIFAGKGLIDVDCFHELLSNRFPEGRVLSHDILEGAWMRCGFLSDVEMTDTAPIGMTSWLTRLHRWLRGDWQNIIFTASRYRVDGQVWQNPISTLSKYKLFDNLRRSLTPVAALLCLLAALVAPPPAALLLAWSGVLAVTFAPLWAAVYSLFTGGFFTLSRKFFTRTLPHTFELIGQALFLLILLPAQALLTVDAAVRSLWRTYISHKKLLEWTTAAQGDRQGKGLSAIFRRLWPAELFGIAYMVLAATPSLTLLGALFALVIPVAHYSARPSVEQESRLSPKDRDTLISYNAAMWRYYEEYANRQNHFLPPDNIQQSPVFRIATRTSPTNIGMMLLSVLAARDFDFIDTDGLYTRIERTIASVERLAKWHGNLYNWYDTETLDTLKPEFVSTVDSGNFICSLVALAEGLGEYAPRKPELHGLIERIRAIIDNTDLHVFYDKRKNLFSIGYEMHSQSLVNSHYDFLMSEARLTSFYAVARKMVGKKHWGAMGRVMSRWGSYAGPVSWTGTMFEYFMPHLLLPVYDGSLLGESLNYCLYCQKRRARAAGVPWGISESAFYAFDNNLNYQYKAHGVQKLGVKRYLDRELVISPYSTFITLPFNPNSGMRNLNELRERGVYGRYGFYEAVDFTPERVGKDSLAVTRSYMAHHIGMSMVASCNAVFDMRMQRRFMADHNMRSAAEFLQEKIAKNTVVYDDLGAAENREEKQERMPMQEEKRNINPLAPQCMLLTNGELTDVLTDTGAGYLKFGEVDLTRRESDLLRRAQGILTIARMDSVTLPATAAPFYDREAAYRVEQQEGSITFLAEKRDIELGVRCLAHPTISCQQRQIVVGNRSATKQIAEILCYLEPVLAPYSDYSAHPAYSKLFLSAHYDAVSKTVTFSRRNRDSSVDLFLTIGFLQEDIDFALETHREALMASPAGLSDLLRFADRPFPPASTETGGTPDACCALRFDLLVPAGGQQQATLLISAARSHAEGIQNIITMRKIGMLEPKNAAKSPLPGDSLAARLGGTALGELFFTTTRCDYNRADKRQNRLGQNALWSAGISGDYPIALVELPPRADLVTLEAYLRLHRSLRSLALSFDLVVLCADGEQQEQCRTLAAEQSGASIIGARGGVFLLDTSGLAAEMLTLLRAVARHTAAKAGSAEQVPLPPYRPALFRAVAPAPMPRDPALSVTGGCFAGGRFYVDKSSPLPWSHVLANSQFGTLVSSDSLGCTWAINSRENKLTPWYNDTTTDNTGEMCVLHDGDSYYNLTHGARASFSDTDAHYEGLTPAIGTAVTITVSDSGFAKYIEITLQNRTDKAIAAECAYYTEPVLGVNRDTARHIHAERSGKRDNVLALHNPYNTAVPCWAALAGEGEEVPRLMTDRASFLCGDWQSLEIEPTNDPCAAVILPVSLPAGGKKHMRFILGYGRTMHSAVYMVSHPLPKREPAHNTFEIITPDEALNQFINHFAPHQILSGRIQARCAFYQCGGAWGFRDQLQDVCAWLLVDPAVTRRHIIRCCAVQFEQGDVLHWWHDLPKAAGGLRGVRTRFSDDLLWLPLAVADYIEKTGDCSLLDVPVHYLKAAELPAGEMERYIAPERSALREDVFHHCIRALERGCNLDERGLPRIGCGDWCDGFSAVGRGGRGTSAWLALFLSIVLTRFAKVCAQRGDATLEHEFLTRAADLKRAVDAHCWDGNWYLRAFYDDGAAMGSHQNDECRIDLLPQSFAVIAGMPREERVDSALQNALDNLVDHKLRLVKLFDPPFQHSEQQPGYVKAYPGGIRENGGQYTHSAVWFAISLLLYGRVDEGYKILEMLCPTDRARHPALMEQYKLEPYYMAADIYTNSDAPGRGGWSLYTGAASWYYRAVLEVLLGLRIRGNSLTLAPRLPSGWPEAELRCEISGTPLHISITRDVEPGLHCDGEPVGFIALDGAAHEVIFGIG